MASTNDMQAPHVMFSLLTPQNPSYMLINPIEECHMLLRLCGRGVSPIRGTTELTSTH